MLSVWYHVYADGQWRDPVDEFLTALGDDFNGTINLGLVGAVENRCRAADYIGSRRFDWKIVGQSHRGWEQVTMVPLRAALKRSGGEVLYAHTKGASDPSEINVLWRRSMTERIVANRNHCVSQIWTQGYDAVGCHWLLPEQYQGLVTKPMFGGNFWIATARFLRTLPPLNTRVRHGAEEWLGSGPYRAKALDLLPGWPSVQLFRESLARQQGVIS